MSRAMPSVNASQQEIRINIAPPPEDMIQRLTSSERNPTYEMEFGIPGGADMIEYQGII